LTFDADVGVYAENGSKVTVMAANELKIEQSSRIV
jgi:hypothetical protein